MDEIKQKSTTQDSLSEPGSPKRVVSAKAILVGLILGNLVIAALIYLLCKFL